MSDPSKYSITTADHKRIGDGIYQTGIVYVSLKNWELFLNDGATVEVGIDRRILIGPHKLPLIAVDIDGVWHGDVEALANAAGIGANMDIASRSVMIGNRRTVPR